MLQQQAKSLFILIQRLFIKLQQSAGLCVWAWKWEGRQGSLHGIHFTVGKDEIKNTQVEKLQFLLTMIRAPLNWYLGWLSWVWEVRGGLGTLEENVLGRSEQQTQMLWVRSDLVGLRSRKAVIGWREGEEGSPPAGEVGRAPGPQRRWCSQALWEARQVLSDRF